MQSNPHPDPTNSERDELRNQLISDMQAAVAGGNVEKLADWTANWISDREHRKTLEAQAKIDLLYKKFKKLDAAIFAVMFYIDKPYPDDPRWTPYTRFIGPRMKMLQAAFDGEDIGDLEGMARLQSQLPKKERTE